MHDVAAYIGKRRSRCTPSSYVSLSFVSSASSSRLPPDSVCPRKMFNEKPEKQLNEYEQSASEAGAGGDTQNALALSSFGGGAGPGSQTDLVPWGGDGAMGASDGGAMQLRPYNQRIELPNVDDSDGEGGRGGGTGGAGGGSGDDDGIHDLDEDELTRDKVKKAASHVRYDVMASGRICRSCLSIVRLD